jgi:hypothetical protein
MTKFRLREESKIQQERISLLMPQVNELKNEAQILNQKLTQLKQKYQNQVTSSHQKTQMLDVLLKKTQAELLQSTTILKNYQNHLQVNHSNHGYEIQKMRNSLQEKDKKIQELESQLYDDDPMNLIEELQNKMNSTIQNVGNRLSKKEDPFISQREELRNLKIN